MDKRHSAKAFAFVLFALSLLIVHFLWDISSVFDIGRIRALIEDAGVFAPLLIIVLTAVAVVISPLPGLPLDMAGGAMFGPFAGTLYAVIGGLSGAIISFLIARFFGRGFIERFLGGHINFCTECSDRLLTKVVFLSRLIPFISFDIVSYGAGLTKMSIKRFIVATFFGMVPMTFLYTSFGSVFVVGAKLSLIMGLIMVVLFFLIPRWIEKRNLLSLDKIFKHAISKEIVFRNHDQKE